MGPARRCTPQSAWGRTGCSWRGPFSPCPSPRKRSPDDLPVPAASPGLLRRPGRDLVILLRGDEPPLGMGARGTAVRRRGPLMDAPALDALPADRFFPLE